MVNFGGPLAAEIVSLVWGTPANFNGFRFLAALLHCQTAALKRGRHLYSAGRLSLWALTHVSSFDLTRCATTTLWLRLIHRLYFSVSFQYRKSDETQLNPWVNTNYGIQAVCYNMLCLNCRQRYFGVFQVARSLSNCTYL